MNRDGVMVRRVALLKDLQISFVDWALLWYSLVSTEKYYSGDVCN
jgi:hypothetical protein